MHRTLIATVLVGFLSAATPSSLLDQIWSLMASLWTESPSSDAGCGWDPNGRCWPADSGSKPIENTQTKAGCGWDPNGGCIPKP
jgi:hypothetical protein